MPRSPWRPPFRCPQAPAGPGPPPGLLQHSLMGEIVQERSPAGRTRFQQPEVTPSHFWKGLEGDAWEGGRRRTRMMRACHGRDSYIPAAPLICAHFTEDRPRPRGSGGNSSVASLSRGPAPPSAFTFLPPPLELWVAALSGWEPAWVCSETHWGFHQCGLTHQLGGVPGDPVSTVAEARGPGLPSEGTGDVLREGEYLA